MIPSSYKGRAALSAILGAALIFIFVLVVLDDPSDRTNIDVVPGQALDHRSLRTLGRASEGAGVARIGGAVLVIGGLSEPDAHGKRIPLRDARSIELRSGNESQRNPWPETFGPYSPAIAAIDATRALVTGTACAQVAQEESADRCESDLSTYIYNLTTDEWTRISSPQLPRRSLDPGIPATVKMIGNRGGWLLLGISRGDSYLVGYNESRDEWKIIDSAPALDYSICQGEKTWYQIPYGDEGDIRLLRFDSTSASFVPFLTVEIDSTQGTNSQLTCARNGVFFVQVAAGGVRRVEWLDESSERFIAATVSPAHRDACCSFPNAVIVSDGLLVFPNNSAPILYTAADAITLTSLQDLRTARIVDVSEQGILLVSQSNPNTDTFGIELIE